MRDHPRNPNIEKEPEKFLEGIFKDVDRDRLPVGGQVLEYPSPAGIRARGREIAQSLNAEDKALADSCEKEYKEAAEYLEREVSVFQGAETLRIPPDRLNGLVDKFRRDMVVFAGQMEDLERKYQLNPLNQTA